MSQAVILKASTEERSLAGQLVVCGFLDSIGINDNKIIYGIPNDIPSPPRLQSVVKKTLEAEFLSIAGFVYKYP